MHTPGKGEDIGGIEAIGLSVKPLTRATLPEYASQIRALKYDVLHPENNRGMAGERREKLDDFRHESLRSEADGAAFVAMRGDKVVGFLAVEKTKSGQYATIGELWTETSGKQRRGISQQLLAAAKAHLGSRYPKLVGESDVLGGDVLRGADTEIKRYARFNAPEDAASNTDMELPYEIPETPKTQPLPEAANDNNEPLREAA